MSTAETNPQPNHIKSPSPPRWRFVNEAKKTAGYSSLSAGINVVGLSAQELAAEYVPPPEESPSKKKEVVEVGKLDTKVLETVYKKSWNGGDVVVDTAVVVENDGEEEDKLVVPEIKTQSTDEADVHADDVLIDIPLVESENDNEEEELKTDSDGKSYKKWHRSIFLVVLAIILVVAVALGITLGTKEPGEDTETTDISLSGFDLLNVTSSSPSDIESMSPSMSPSSSLSENPSRPAGDASPDMVSSAKPSSKASLQPSEVPSTTPSASLSESPSSHPSESITSQSPTTTPTSIIPIDGLTFIGTGFCIDSQGYRYDSYYKTNFGSYQNCGTICNKNDAFRGIVIEDDYRCRCLYEDGSLALGSGYDGYGMTIGGVGEVIGSDGSANAKCYKYLG